jgi:hypothetical protein
MSDGAANRHSASTNVRSVQIAQDASLGAVVDLLVELRDARWLERSDRLG